jgi:hypothetical protein
MFFLAACLPVLEVRYIFLVKIQFFVSDQDLETHSFGSLDPDPIEIKSWIRIRIETNGDLQHCRTVIQFR